ncbi:MAG: hypothetical protein RLZZ164_212 [Actinomycetota bacterium]|jgi:hypothetical protein
MGFIKFMASTAGRVVRFVAGVALVAWGLSASIVWLWLIGLVVGAAGLFDFCIFAPLFKMPLSGKKIRAGK